MSAPPTGLSSGKGLTWKNRLDNPLMTSVIAFAWTIRQILIVVNGFAFFDPFQLCAFAIKFIIFKYRSSTEPQKVKYSRQPQRPYRTNPHKPTRPLPSAHLHVAAQHGTFCVKIGRLNTFLKELKSCGYNNN